MNVREPLASKMCTRVDRPGRSAKRTDLSLSPWPKQSRYFDPDCHDLRHLDKFLAEIEYVPSVQSLVSFIGIKSGVVTPEAGNPLQYGSSISPSDDETIILLIEQARLYYNNSTTLNKLRLDLVSWSQLLARHDIHPSFLDILHSNNGGFHSHISFSESDESVEEPDAMHVMIKIGNCQDVEHAVYGTQDLVTGKTLIVVLGTGTTPLTDNLCRNLRQGGHYDMFRIVATLLAF